MGAKISWVTVVRVPAARPDAARRPRPELAAFVHLVTDRADDGSLREILRSRRVAHAKR